MENVMTEIHVRMEVRKPNSKLCDQVINNHLCEDLDDKIMCPRCEGRLMVRDKVCSVCQGEGEVDLSVKTPPMEPPVSQTGQILHDIVPPTSATDPTETDPCRYEDNDDVSKFLVSNSETNQTQ